MLLAIEKLGLFLLGCIQAKSKDKLPRWMWLTLMPFDASDMFVKPEIRLCIEVIIFQLFVWKLSELMGFSGPFTQQLLSGLLPQKMYKTEDLYLFRRNKVYIKH